LVLFEHTLFHQKRDGIYDLAKLMKENYSQRKNSEREGKQMSALTLGALINDVLSRRSETLGSTLTVPKMLVKDAA